MTIQLPNKNQPIDSNFLYQLITEINRIDNLVSSTSEGIATQVANIKNNSKLIKNLIFFANQVAVGTTGKTSAIQTIYAPFTSVRFSQSPIVTATLEATTTIAERCVIFVSDVTTSGCNINIRWLDEPKTAGMLVNISAIGYSS